MNYKFSSTRPEIVETIGAKRYLNFDIEEVVNENENEKENGSMESETMKPETQFRYLQAEGNIFNWDYSHLVAAIVRAKYSADDVEAILLNRGDGDEEHEAQYNELQEWRRHAKTIAKSVITGE